MNRRLIVLIGTLVFLITILAAAGVIYQQTRTGRPMPVPVSETPVPVTTPQVAKPLTMGSITDSKHTVSLFVDPHCSHCVAFEQTNGDLLDRLVREGTISLEIYATSFQGKASERAAAGMYCASTRDYGYAYYRSVFANPTAEWTSSQLTQLATDLKGSADAGFATCLAEPATTAWVVSQRTVAVDTFQIEGTPTVLIDGADTPLDQISSPEALERKLG